ncbi:MAG TPA: NAD(P)/FAD-dependent oxidoreductase [Acidimicrobiales bacterium]
MQDSVSIVIIGAGPGGLCMGAKLLEAGFDDFVILERADGVGGTWRHNTYPGCACDVQSHLYSFSFAPKVDWTRAYATQPEILQYFEQFAVDFGLMPHIRLHTTVHGARWDDDRARWRITTSNGEIESWVLVGAVGMFGDLSWPDIPGLDSFGGTLFHSARWNHDHDLTGERVAVIGTAASAVQFVPVIAPQVGALHVFQRQAQWVLPKVDPEFTPEEIERFRSDPAAAAALRQEIYDRIESVITFSNPDAIRAAEQLGLDNLEVVKDPEVRRKLTPTTRWGCHRPLTSNTYYPTFNLPHVELVTEPIERITSDGLVTPDGVERQVDTIIAATGFATTKYLSVIDVIGRGGLSLNEAWDGGATAYLGITTAGFPNLFMLYGPNTNNGSILHMIECQVAYIVRWLTRMRDEGATVMEVKADAQATYNEQLQRDLDRVEVWRQGACHGYYRSASGRIVTQWPHTMTRYREITERPDLDAYLVA